MTEESQYRCDRHAASSTAAYLGVVAELVCVKGPGLHCLCTEGQLVAQQGVVHLINGGLRVGGGGGGGGERQERGDRQASTDRHGEYQIL